MDGISLNEIKEKINKQIEIERDNTYYSDLDYRFGIVVGLKRSIEIIEEFEKTRGKQNV